MLRNPTRRRPHSLSVRTHLTRRGVSFHYSLLVNTSFECYKPGTCSSRAEDGAGEDAILRGKVLFNWRRTSAGEQNYPETALNMKKGLWSRLHDLSNVLFLMSVESHTKMPCGFTANNLIRNTIAVKLIEQPEPISLKYHSILLYYK